MTDLEALTRAEAASLRLALHDLLNRAIDDRSSGSLGTAITAAEVLIARDGGAHGLALKAAHASELLHELRQAATA